MKVKLGPYGPSHLTARSDDKRTLCGIRTADDASFPRLCARFVGAHRRGHAMTVCPECEGVALRDGIDLDCPGPDDPEIPGQRTIYDELEP